jgi:hypothetical protein
MLFDPERSHLGYVNSTPNGKILRKAAAHCAKEMTR